MKTGTAMTLHQMPKRKKKQVNCYKCKNYLETNPLCQMNRKTPRKVCKWFIPGRSGSKPKKIKFGKTMKEVCANINKAVAEKKKKISKEVMNKK